MIILAAVPTIERLCHCGHGCSSCVSGYVRKGEMHSIACPITAIKQGTGFGVTPFGRENVWSVC